MAGGMYMLNCTVSKRIYGLKNVPISVWTVEGMEISDTQLGIQISNTSTDNAFTSILTFNPLKTTHGNKYCCKGTLTSSAIPFQLDSTQQHQVIVQSKKRNLN